MHTNLLIAGLMLCSPFCAPALTQAEQGDTTAQALNEIIVKGTRRMAKITPDGFSVPVQNTYLARSGTAMDLLGKIPFVTASQGELTVTGKGTPAVYINGREVRDTTELERLASDQIKKVEVITSPGARYAGTVNAVIRISTVAPAGEGFSLNDRTTVGYKHYAYLFQQLDMNWRHKGLDIFTMLNLEDYRARASFETNTTEYFPHNTVTKDIAGQVKNKYPVYGGKAGINYSTDRLNAGAFYEFRYQPGNGTSRSTTLRHSADGDEYLDNAGTNSSHDRRHQFSAYASGTFGRWEMSANFDAIWTVDDSRVTDNELSDMNAPRLVSTLSAVDNRFLAANALVSAEVWKGKLAWGAEWSDIRRDDRYAADTEFITSAHTRINETNAAAFGELEQRFGALQLKAGLRWEYTTTEYTLDGIRRDDQSRHYSQLFPSASAGYTIGDISLRASYSHRTSRPAFGQLSGTVRYTDRYTYESGNPYLRPIYRDFVSLTVQWKDLYAEGGYRSTRNYFMWQTEPYAPVPGATLSKMQNMPRFGSWWAMAEWAPAFGTWHPVVSASVEANDFTVEHHGSPLKLNRPIGYFRLDNALKLPGDIWVNLDLSASTSGNADNAFIKSSWGADIAVHRSFAGGSLDLRLELDDVFASRRTELTWYDALSRLQSAKHWDTRDLVFTLRYKFNAARSRYRGTGAANADKRRL